MVFNNYFKHVLLWLLSIWCLVWFSSMVRANQALPLPRFASLRSNEVNLRVGPGSEYPLEWVFRYEKMPIEIIQEFGLWRKIRDFEKDEGWVHQSMLSGRRMALIMESNVILRKTPEETAKGIAQLQRLTSGHLLECQSQWCRIQIHHHKGWLRRTQIWGVYANEIKF